MTTRNQFQYFLTNEQIQELVDVVIEQYGTGLSGNELVESIRLVLEDIPGIEMESTQEIHCIVNEVRYLYDDKHQNRNEN